MKRVYATARTPFTLDEVVALDEKRVVAVKLDVTKEADARTVAARAGDVNLIINNATILDIGASADISVDTVRANMETNFFGTLNATRAFIPAYVVISINAP